MVTVKRHYVASNIANNKYVIVLIQHFKMNHYLSSAVPGKLGFVPFHDA